MNISRLLWLIATFIPLLFFGVAILPVAAEEVGSSAEPLPAIAIVDSPHTTGIVPLGINLGSHNVFGASQILKNIIPNPGLEGGEYSMIFLTKGGSPTGTVQADNYYATWDQLAVIDEGQPAGFWNGASFESIWGGTHGMTGTVVSFTLDSDLQTYQLSVTDTLPAAGDVFVVRKTITDSIQACCVDANYVPDTAERRPGSPGEQSLRMLQPDGSKWVGYSLYLDSYYRDGDTSAGKLMEFNGTWQLSFWIKAETISETLDVRLYRERTTPFLRETLVLSNTWTQITRTFTVTNDKQLTGTLALTPTLLALQMWVAGDADAIWLDDISLERVTNDGNDTIFSSTFVNAVRELKPGIVRNWGNQLGSSLDNQLAEPFARKTTGWKPDNDLARAFHYSIQEFLVLAELVNADPWYVIPPTWTNDEVANFAAFLTAPISATIIDTHPYALKRQALGRTEPWTDAFNTIHLEFGNEMWGSAYGGDPFWGATVRGGQRVGQISAERFAAFRGVGSVDAADFNLIIGGQVGFPPQNAHIENSSDMHDALALAPYFGQLNTWANDAEIFQPLFANPTFQLTHATSKTVLSTTNMLQANAISDTATSVAIYEVNFHTTSGVAPLGIRNDFVTSQAGGIALPLHILALMRDVGATHQAAFNILQYSFPVWDNAANVTSTLRIDAPPPWYLQRQFEQQLMEPSLDAPADRASARAEAQSTPEFVRLWGLLRDLEASGRPRPTWYGLKLLNDAVRPTLLNIDSARIPTWTQSTMNGITRETVVPKIQSFAFKGDVNDYSLILFNLDLTQTHTVHVSLPYFPLTNTPAKMSVLSADSIHDDNEDVHMVNVVTSTAMLTGTQIMTIAPHTMVVYEWTSTQTATTHVELSAQHANRAPTGWIAVGIILLMAATIRLYRSKPM